MQPSQRRQQSGGNTQWSPLLAEVGSIGFSTLVWNATALVRFNARLREKHNTAYLDGGRYIRPPLRVQNGYCEKCREHNELQNHARCLGNGDSS